MSPGTRCSVLALVDGRSCMRGATVVHHEPRVVQVEMDEPLPLPVGSVVGVWAADGAMAALAVVNDSVGPTVTVLRIVERRVSALA